MSKRNRLKHSKTVVAFLSLPMIVRFLVVLLAVLLAAFTGVMFSQCAQEWIGGLLGITDDNNKNEILKFLGVGMGGVLIAIQAVQSYMRAKAMEDAANAQAKATVEQAKANENAERGLRQERLKNAIEHLGHVSVSVRLGGAYELFHLAQDTPNLRQTAMDILCAHIRRTTGEAEYREKHLLKPSEEIQSLLTLLFVQEHEVFKGLYINLQGSWLNGAELREARLEEANLVGVCLPGANLQEAHLQGAILRDAQLQGANLAMTLLPNANLHRAQLQGAGLMRAVLPWAFLQEAQLHGAILVGAYLKGAILTEAHLEGVDLVGANLEGAYLEEAHLQGAVFYETHLKGVTSNKPEPPFDKFVERIRGLVGRQSDLSGVIFAGGLSGEDVDSIIEGLPDDKAEYLREKLAPHIGQPKSHELPQDSEAITGAYSAEEAEEWIAEYEKAMSNVPKEETDTGNG